MPKRRRTGRQTKPSGSSMASSSSRCARFIRRPCFARSSEQLPPARVAPERVQVVVVLGEPAHLGLVQLLGAPQELEGAIAVPRHGLPAGGVVAQSPEVGQLLE